MFSSILDISSFFIGMLINLLLIALICYYFKRKYESLEVAQNEQAKILYNLIQSQTPRKQFDINELMNNNMTKSLNTFEVIESDSESDSDSESEDESSRN
jgi:F0F1-type ATP synthase membrane subunit b/b'